MSNFHHFKSKVSQEARLLTFVKTKVDFTTVDVRWAIEHQRCFVNGKMERFTSRKLRANDFVELFLEKRPRFVVEASRVLFEDEHLLAYNKPPYLSSTGEMSLETLLQLKALHRLDRDTTGVILMGKSERASQEIEGLFREHKIEKSYLAKVIGLPSVKKGTIKGNLVPIDRREGAVKMGLRGKGENSHTDWEVVRSDGIHSLIRCFPKTGKTHQIRVHLASIGHPIVGDPLYGTQKDRGIFRPLLHAESIRFILPWTNSELLVQAPLLDNF